MSKDKTEGRVLLPDFVLPSRYEVRLVPDLVRFVFDGKCNIEVEVHEGTAEIKLHARELQLKSAVFKPAEGDSLDVETISYDFKKKVVTLIFGEILPVGKGVLSIDYVGELNDQMAGFYRSSYTDIHGVKKIMASTQFEATDARRCFPCWDEPARKAIFAVTLVVDPALTAFSNMPEKSSKLVKTGSKVVREIEFMDSPKMSTYLLAFVVGEFDFVQAKTEHGVLVRVYTPPGRSEEARFPLDTAIKCLDLYDDFFGLPYPLPKLDMVAIPEFAAGAMENWGLVTYREVDLLVDLKTASSQQKQRVCIVVTHELAHQWFGNLVTMAWWDDLWLNEGFASWCENYAADVIYPDYQIWEQFASDTLAAALKLDSLKTSHPIQVPIAEADEVDEVFDAISYCKGASVIRMAHAVMGHEDFKKGLQIYMKRHQYSNTETFHLWNAWEESSGRAIKDMMSSWTEQMGFPILQVKSCTWGSTVKIQLEQSWYLSSGEAPPEEKTWNIPLFVSTKSSSKTIMMAQKSQEIEIPLSAGDDDFVLLNAGVLTPLRVCYNAEMRGKIVKALKAGHIKSSDRAGLVMDAYALAKSGQLEVDEALRFLVGFVGETDYIVLDALSAVLNGFQKVFMGGFDEQVYKKYMELMESFVGKSWHAVDPSSGMGPGWTARPEEGHLDGLRRGALMKLMAKFCPRASFIEESKRRFQKYIENPQENATELPDEYRVPVLQAVLQVGGDTEFSQVKELYKKLTTNVDQKHVFSSIGYANDPKHKTECLQWSISGEVKMQDFFYVMNSVSASSRQGLDMTWAFYKSEFEGIKKFVKDAAPSIMEAAISVSTGGFSSDEMATEVEQFFEAHPLPLNKRKISQVLEEIRSSASFVKRAKKSDVVKSEFWEGLIKSMA